MRADIHDGPEQMLQSKAGYIDARPLTTRSTKTSCNARPDHTSGSECEILYASRCFPLRLQTQTFLDAVGTSHLCQQRSYRYPPAIRARTLNANSSGTAQARVHRSGLGVPRNATVMAIRSSRARTRRSIGSESTRFNADPRNSPTANHIKEFHTAELKEFHNAEGRAANISIPVLTNANTPPMPAPMPVIVGQYLNTLL